MRITDYKILQDTIERTIKEVIAFWPRKMKKVETYRTAPGLLAERLEEKLGHKCEVIENRDRDSNRHELLLFIKDLAIPIRFSIRIESKLIDEEGKYLPVRIDAFDICYENEYIATRTLENRITDKYEYLIAVLEGKIEKQTKEILRHFNDIEQCLYKEKEIPLIPLDIIQREPNELRCCIEDYNYYVKEKESIIRTARWERQSSNLKTEDKK